MNPDDLDPPRPVLKPLDLQIMSVAELNDYIFTLKAEIDRAQDTINEKLAHRAGAESLFS